MAEILDSFKLDGKVAIVTGAISQNGNSAHVIDKSKYTDSGNHQIDALVYHQTFGDRASFEYVGWVPLRDRRQSGPA